MSTLPRSEHAFGFTSPRPRVRLVHAFERPFENVVATARTCYSARGIVTEDQASAKPERRDALAKSIYAAGHHTTFQHAHFQFALENVSRQFLWSFLHSHPFYNSEQVSQRYVEVKSGNYAVPPMGAAEREIFETTAQRQELAYRRLTELLTPLAGERYFGLFPGRLRGVRRVREAPARDRLRLRIPRRVRPRARRPSLPTRRLEGEQRGDSRFLRTRGDGRSALRALRRRRDRARARPLAQPDAGRDAHPDDAREALARALPPVVHVPQEAFPHRRQPGPASPHDARFATRAARLPFGRAGLRDSNAPLRGPRGTRS